ncbi:MAG: beta strand repeat-containing protein, partial [Phycisphaerae bacterium]
MRSKIAPNRFSRRISLLAIAAAMATAVPVMATSVASPATDNWNGTAGDGKFSTAGNWSTGAVPTASDIAVFDLGAANTYTVTLGSTSYSSQMVVDNNALTLATGEYDYTLSGTGAIGTGNESLIVGNGATDTAADLTLGTNGYRPVSGVNGTIGEVSGSVGTLTIGAAGNSYGGNALQLSGTLAVGYGGKGTLTINAGTAGVGGDLDIAALSGSIGKVDIELTSAGGCSFGPTPLKVGGNLYVGGSASGAGGTGTLLINGTNGTNGQYGSGSYGVRATGTATIYSGATVTLNRGLLEAASISNSGTLNFTGGTLDLTNSGMTVGSSGLLGPSVTLGSGKTLEISGTTNVAAGDVLAISGGELDTGVLSSSGSISFTAGTLSITNSDLIIDTGGPLGNNVSLSSGQTLNVKNNNLVIGNTGTGNLAIGSSANANANQIFIGAQAGSNGNMTVDGTVGGGPIFVGGNAGGAGGSGTLTVNSDADMYGGTITVWSGGVLVDNAAVNLNNSISIQSGGNMNTTGSSSIYASSVTNAGLLEVQNGSLSLSGGGPLTNTGGTIQADNGTTVQLFAATVSGGTLAGIGTGNFVSTSATLDGTPSGGLTNNTVIGVPDSGSATASDSLTLQGTIINNGQINITSTGDDTWLYINGPTTISGTGTITLTDKGGNTAFLAGAASGTNDSLTNEGTIQGSGTVGNSIATNADLLSFANSGIINADVSGKTLMLGATYTFSNTGTLEATNGGTLVFRNGAI